MNSTALGRLSVASRFAAAILGGYAFAFGFVALASLAGLVGGLFATQSRGGWLAAIRRQWGRVVLLGGGALVAELAILTFARSGRLADMLGKGQDTKNVDYRQDLLTQGLDQIKAHPLFGQPTDQLIANMSGLRQGEGIVD
ncbi:MAG: O-antigen ligase domain-containing protein, partial [Burkholderiales bacterium]